MRRPLIAVALLAWVALGWTLTQSSGDAVGGLVAQSADAGGVEVAVTPVQLDADVARFEIAFDTHTVDLDLEPASGAALVVGSTPWGPATWDGDRAGGHHVSGQLSFAAQGQAQGAVQLSIGGLPAPVTFEWNVETP